MEMSYFLVVMMGGFAGSLHCVGMCGGFACGLGSVKSVSRYQLMLKNAFYNVGRLTSYTFIGAMAGVLGATLVGTNSSNDLSGSFVVHAHASHFTGHMNMPVILNGEAGVIQSLLSLVAGVLMVLMALQLLGFRRYVVPSWGRYGAIAMARILNTLVRSDRMSASVALGVINGFLPCPLVFAFAAVAAASGSFIVGTLTMSAFGLGTFPAMLFMGMAGMMLSPLVRQYGVWLSGVFILLIGLLTIVRGLLPGLHGIM